MIVCFIILFFSFISVAPSFSITEDVNSPIKRLPDTGQERSFTDIYGEDSDFSHYPPTYVDPGDGTIIDTVTGLQWQKMDGGEMTYNDAITYCDSLTIAGYSDWRLPSPIEAFSLQYFDRTNPAINTTYFTKTGAEYWWTNTRQYGDDNKIWVTNAGGGIGNHPMGETRSAGGDKNFHTRAVRTIHIEKTHSPRFIIHNNGTVTDNLTLLQWTSVPHIQALTWNDALLFAQECNVASYTDWRLPNIKELQSLHNPSSVNPAVFSPYFPSINISTFWSSTTLQNQPQKAWFFDSKFGITSYEDKTKLKSILCVRTIQTDTLSDITDNDIKTHYIASPNIFPNPTHSFCVVNNVFGDFDYEIFTPDGTRCIHERSKNIIDLSSLPYGLYFIRLNTSSMYLPCIKSAVIP
jgi:hypothetical protein